MFILDFELLFKKNFHKLYFAKRKEINNIITFIFINMKIKYDFKYLVISFQKNDKVYFKLYYNFSIFGVFDGKLL